MSIVGIMVLEKQLLQMEDDGQSSRKRARSSVSPTSEVTTSWIELAKLVSKLMYIHCMLFNRPMQSLTRSGDFKNTYVLRKFL